MISDRGFAMMPNTRKFLLGSALVVTAGLCTGLVAYYGGVLPQAAAQGSGELVYIPADVSAVAYADVRHIMDSEFRQRLRAAIPTGSEKDKFFQATGIDIERDIDAVIAGIVAEPETDDGHRPNGVVLLRGRFDQARIETAATGHGASQEQYGGRALLLPPADAHAMVSPADPDARGVVVDAPAVAFLEDGLLAIGQADQLRHAIDIAARGSSIADNPDMMRLIASVQGTGDAWFVARASEMTGRADLPDPVRSHLDGIQWISAVADIDSSVRTLVRAEARDEQSAKNLRDMLNGALAAARMFAGEDPRTAAALNSIQTSGTGLNIELSFEIPATVLDLVPPALVHEPASLR
jgi:hypothetical protein